MRPLRQLLLMLVLLLGLPLFSRAAVPPRYEVVPDWPLNGGRGVPDYRRGEVTGVAVDAQGNVYMCQGRRHPVLVFDREGRFLRTWGGGGLLNEPHSLRIDPEGYVWIADFAQHRVLKFTPEGSLVLALGARNRWGRDAAHFNGPTDVAFGANGEVYVADGYGNARIVRFSAAGEYLGEWGGPGDGPGEFFTPHSVAVDAQGRVYVADRENSRIQVFTAEGALLQVWPLPDRPFGLFITPEQELYVANGYHCTIAVYDLNGTRLAYWGKRRRAPRRPNRESGNRRAVPRKPGRLAEPHMLWIDAEGALYTAELAGHRIQKFVPAW